MEGSLDVLQKYQEATHVRNAQQTEIANIDILGTVKTVEITMGLFFSVVE